MNKCKKCAEVKDMLLNVKGYLDGAPHADISRKHMQSLISQLLKKLEVNP